MRRLPPRSNLSAALLGKLATKAALIMADVDPSEKAETVFNGIRGTAWFSPVVNALKSLAGKGEPCMFCSGSEASQVEHYRPKKNYPQTAMTWLNFTWCCGLCNQHKGNRFPQTSNGEYILNPLDDYVWNHYFIDQYGNLTEQWREALNDFDPRALLTTHELKLDRQALQERRQFRLVNLHEIVEGVQLKIQLGIMDITEAREVARKWLEDPAQPDVADYFLRGPGRATEPFSLLLEVIGELE
jgi:hypothetical protein